jgi:hypothetical protein
MVGPSFHLGRLGTALGSPGLDTLLPILVQAELLVALDMQDDPSKKTSIREGLFCEGQAVGAPDEVLVNLLDGLRGVFADELHDLLVVGIPLLVLDAVLGNKFAVIVAGHVTPPLPCT